jgi:hypothetical protein
MSAATFSPMLFTHCAPGFVPFGAARVGSLQIYSIKLAKIKHLKWPLYVYGVVAARDYVDNKRNILFYRTSRCYQTLTKNVSIVFFVFVLLFLLPAC